MIGPDDPILLDMLRKHEDERMFAYDDETGMTVKCDGSARLTIGVGRNLQDNGLTKDEITYLLMNDTRRAYAEAVQFHWFEELSDNRQRVVVDMLFNLGRKRFGTFVKMIAALERQDFQNAVHEMMNSKWRQQVKTRADTLMEMMRQG